MDRGLHSGQSMSCTASPADGDRLSGYCLIRQQYGGQAVTRGRCSGPAMRLEMLNPRTLWDSRWLMTATEHSCHGPPAVIFWFCYNHTFSSAPPPPLPLPSKPITPTSPACFTRFRPIAALAGMPAAAPIDRLRPCCTYCTPPPPDS